MTTPDDTTDEPSVSTAAVRDPEDPTVADELVAIAPPGAPDGEVDTRPGPPPGRRS